MDYYTCIACHKTFDEFEMNFKQVQIDNQILCKECRKAITNLAKELMDIYFSDAVYKGEKFEATWIKVATYAYKMLKKEKSNK